MAAELQELAQAKATAIDLMVRFGPRVLVAALLLTAGFVIGGWLGRAVARTLHRFEIDDAVSTLICRIVRTIVLLLFAAMALQNLGVELLPLIAGLGVAGAGIALALQGVLGNLAAGLTIVFTRPFRIGEYVAIVGVEGKVEEISLFSTVLGHPDRSRIVIPNRKIVGEILHNYGDIRQVDVRVQVDYGTDLSTAYRTVREVLAGNPRVLREPAPFVQVVELADSGVLLAVKGWVAVPDFQGVASELRETLLAAFRARGIGIPFPTREVRLVRGPDLRGAEPSGPEARAAD
jgi:small conductance mechanosensitive channel